MATQGIEAMEAQPVQFGHMWRAPEKATQTFLLGALLVWDASGGVAEAAANGANVPINLAGIAQEAGHNGGALGTFSCDFARIQPGLIIECNLAVIGANTRVLAVADIGALCGFDKRTIGTAHWVATTAHTQAHGRIIGIAKGHALGDINARVYVTVLPADHTTAGIKYITF